MRSGHIDYYISRLGSQRHSRDTISRHFRRLESLGYITCHGLLLRPTIRLRGQDVEHFKPLLEEFIEFIKGQGKYLDVLEQLSDRLTGLPQQP